MAERKLCGGFKLGHRLPQFRKKERKRVVAKTQCPTCCRKDGSFHSTVSSRDDFTVARGCEDTAVAPAAICFGGAVERFEEDLVITLVDRKTFGWSEACIFGVTRGAHTGRASQSIDFKPGVICHDNQARRLKRVVDRLGAGVA